MKRFNKNNVHTEFVFLQIGKSLPILLLTLRIGFMTSSVSEVPIQYREEASMGYGKKIWVFPDAELPPIGVNEIPGHESIIITNLNEKSAHITISWIYTDRTPLVANRVDVGAKRVRCLRTNDVKDFGSNTAIEGEQYAILLESDVPVVAQYGRAEPRTVNFYTTPGYCE